MRGAPAISCIDVGTLGAIAVESCGARQPEGGGGAGGGAGGGEGGGEGERMGEEGGMYVEGAAWPPSRRSSFIAASPLHVTAARRPEPPTVRNPTSKKPKTASRR